LGFYRRFGSLCPRLLMIITAWELVSCKDADTNSPATGGLLAVDFGPDSSSVPGRKSASIEDFGRLNWSVLACVGLPIWAAFRFFFTGGVLCVQRKKTINGGETTPFQGRATVFQFGPRCFDIFKRTPGQNSNETPVLRNLLQNSPWTLISCNFNLNQSWILIFLQYFIN
jgi:hypothetical protein